MKRKYLLHIALFILTFITTTIAGVEWTTGQSGPFTIENLMLGLPYSISIMFMITCHEFGHFFAAKYHKVDATLPFYIPLPSIFGFLNFGTMGAVIKTKSPVETKKAMFDIGITGPLAGFIASLIILLIGFFTLPGIEFLQKIHPNYPQYEQQHGYYMLYFGDNILFHALRMIFSTGGNFIPPMSEIYHYPYLCVGWFGLFITSMNLIPVGQLDGGHIVYSMFKKHSYKIAIISFAALMLLGISGLITTLLDMTIIGWNGWLLWGLVLFFFIKLKHPEIYDNVELDRTRMILGYFILFVLVISFSPSPIILQYVP